MSGTWRTATVARVCGRCRATIPAGTPARVIALPGLRRALVRCAACVALDGAAPPPDQAPADPAPLSFARFTARVVPFDWKARASGARDPGQEG